ncbi:MAG: ATP-grasp domain-containing protein [Deltaproteobacteria bacterium]|nr:MAG: ATP-grasp domain-containing protein [Deltaproteobacteria bacterium]
MAEIKKILIANRGEIAVRVINTCRTKGIKTVSIYKPEEKKYPHALLADESICLGEGTLGETYLNHDLLVEIAKKHNVDAIHPGYGFLSENAKFSSRVRKEGIIFIGPSEDSMKLMGDKISSKVKMEEIKAPLIPGYHGDNQDPAFLAQKAKEIGYPVLVKASAGGGGKGMRIVKSDKEFNDSLAAAKREAMNAFGDDKVLVEKFIVNPRHIEVQVFSDRYGNHLHLLERECSIQRRYQKIVEESPSPALTPEIRKEITETAAKIAAGIDYEGAGTVEFILDEDGKFYFLEMNTRLQVEHPVTEMITGLDLVDLQIQVAEGKPLPLKQEDVVARGHAIEVRLYAEDPDNEFLPSTGKIERVGFPSMPGTRLDTGFEDGNEVTINFDPMLAKLIVHSSTRDQAIEKMKTVLPDVPFYGVKTNRDYLMRILKHPKFVEGETFTHFVETWKSELGPNEMSAEEMAKAILVYLKAGKSSHSEISSSRKQPGPWDTLSSLRNV